MWAKIKSVFARMFHQPAMGWWEEQYLNAAQNAGDLEHRQRQLLQGLARTQGFQ